MAYTYRGTKITGQSTTAKVFKGTGISSAKKNQTYFNTAWGNVYICTEAGNASKAKWKYTRTDIAKTPHITVEKLSAPSRPSGRKIKATWNVPASLKNTKSGSRAEGLWVTWTLNTNDKKNTYKGLTVKHPISSGGSEINLDGLRIGNTTFRRSSFHPLTPGRYLTAISVTVRGYNSKGSGKSVTQSKKITAPRAPYFSAWNFNTESGDISITVNTNAGNDFQERYDTVYKMTAKNTRTGKTSVIHSGITTSTSLLLNYDPGDYQQLTYDQYIQVTVEAYSRGYAGNSKVVKSTYYLGYPARVTLQSVKAVGEKMTAYIETNHTAQHPVDRVKLEYLANTTYSRAEDIPPEEEFTATEITDDNICTALAMPVANLVPDRGKYTWVRVKSWHADEAKLYRYSNYLRITDLETPAATAADDDIVILSAVAGKDGKSIIVSLGWNADGLDDSTGTELTWSDAEDSWKSTDDPESYNFTWSDGLVTVGAIEYRDSASITIKGLSESTKYYVRARRYLETDDGTTYSEYSNTATCVTSETPETIVASCNQYVSEGETLPIYWTFSGNGIQKEWQIVDSNGTILANGEGSAGSTKIDATRLASFAQNNSITFTVQASTGSGFVVSEEHMVTIMNAPELEITPISPLLVQPYHFSARVERPCDLIVIITARGAVGQYPEGILRQTEGDTVHSDVYVPQWETDQETETLTATITIPAGLDFWDTGEYILSVVAVDRETGLHSEEKRETFTVAWTHQAPSIVPTTTYIATTDTVVVEDKAYYAYDSTAEVYVDVMPEGDEDPSAIGWYEQAITTPVALTPMDTIDENGLHHQAVQIALVPPAGAAETDVYDIYRMTGDGAQLIGEGFPQTYTATDEYAPFGDDLTHQYRIAIRTADGDISFADFEYDLPCDFMRFDWSAGSLELPYNISIGDKYKKDVDIRQHMDGSNDGYWNPNIERSASLNSDVIRLTMQDEIDSARGLARHPGAVFVRTPDGSAYEADVQVSDMSTEGQMTAIAIDATEIGLTQEFALPTPFVTEEEENG